MKYKLVDQQGTVIAKGSKSNFNISVDFDNGMMTFNSKGKNTICDIEDNDKFTLTFEDE